MQMSRLYESTNKKMRAAAYRKAGRECRAAGYTGIADVNDEMAELLDPTPREKPEPDKKSRRSQSQGKHETQHVKGSGNSGVANNEYNSSAGGVGGLRGRNPHVPQSQRPRHSAVGARGHGAAAATGSVRAIPRHP